MSMSIKYLYYKTHTIQYRFIPCSRPFIYKKKCTIKTHLYRKISKALLKLNCTWPNLLPNSTVESQTLQYSTYKNSIHFSLQFIYIMLMFTSWKLHRSPRIKTENQTTKVKILKSLAFVWFSIVKMACPLHCPWSKIRVWNKINKIKAHICNWIQKQTFNLAESEKMGNFQSQSKSEMTL